MRSLQRDCSALSSGRVRASEILEALRRCGERLEDLGSLIPAADGLPLEAIDASKPAGKALLGAARHILHFWPFAGRP